MADTFPQESHQRAVFERMYTLFCPDCWSRKLSLTKAGRGHLVTEPSVLLGYFFSNNADVYIWRNPVSWRPLFSNAREKSDPPPTV